MKTKQRQLLWILLIEAVLIWMVDRRHRPEPKPIPLAPTINSFTALPSTITFTSSDPDAGATGTATVTLVIGAAASGHTWNVTVKTTTTSLTNCSTVPVSAIMQSCGSVGLSSTGGLPTGSCKAASALSTTATQIASGTEGDHINTITINMNYPFTDSWSYVGASSPACSLTLSYTATVN